MKNKIIEFIETMEIYLKFSLPFYQTRFRRIFFHLTKISVNKAHHLILLNIYLSIKFYASRIRNGYIYIHLWILQANIYQKNKRRTFFNKFKLKVNFMLLSYFSYSDSHWLSKIRVIADLLGWWSNFVIKFYSILLTQIRISQVNYIQCHIDCRNSIRV